MKTVLIIIIFHIFLFTANGQNIDSVQTDKPIKRPKIGLVLSGGGARGFAHIGVLKVLEENRIPVDYIVGASMGGLIGSLYATGKTPAEMEQLVATLDWDKLLSGQSSYEELSYRRKEDRRNLPGSLSLKGRNLKSLKLPNSLNPGFEIGLAIDNLFLPYSEIENFDNLPIPFRTVATDLLNAETVVLKSGSLQQSLRATMSIPGVFTPVEINERILADGGILNNIPTDVAKNMGADIILVVNIETQIGNRESLETLIGILGQTFIVATIENSRRSLRQADFIIAPDLKNYTTSDFNQSKAIIELGYEGTKQKAAFLRSLSLDEDEWQAHLAARRSRQISETTPRIDFLAVEGEESSKERQIIREKLSGEFINKPLDKSEVENDLTELTGTKRFESLGYELANKNGKEGLLIRVYDSLERTAGKTDLDVGLEVNNNESDTTNFNARGRLTFYDVGGFGSEWRNDISIGSTTLLASEYFRPVGESRFFIAPNALFQNRKVGFYQAGERLAEFSFKTANAGLDFGYSINPKSEVRLGYKIGYQSVSRRIGDPLLPELSGLSNALSLRYNFDGADKAQIPTRGVRLNGSLNYYFDAPGATGGFPQAEIKFNARRPINEQYIALGFGAGGTTFNKTAPTFQQFTVGGLFNVGGYGSEEFRGSNFLRGGIGFLRETYALPSLIGGKFYVGGWYEGGTVFERFGSANYRQSITGGAFLETPVGPIFVGGSLGEGGRRKIYFSLGRFF